MNPNVLLAHFNRVSDAPEAVSRLRRFVLDLAVRGKLVEQDSSDEPACDFLRRIQADKELRGKQVRPKKLRAGQPVSGSTISSLTPAAMRFKIPSSWVWVPFGQIMISRDGERVPVSQEERSRRAKTYDYYGASGIIDKIDGYLFDTPLLLIGEDGANLISRSTPIAFIARGKYWVNNHAHVLDGISDGFLRFIELYVNATDLRPYVTGTAQPKMNQAKMNSIPVALPPEPEQVRIVAKVDELMALCDRLETKQRNRDVHRSRLAAASVHHLDLAADTEVFRQSANFFITHLPRFTGRPSEISILRDTILSLAFRGKLAPRCSSDESVSELIKNIHASKALLAKEGKIKLRAQLPSVPEHTMPFQLPSGWLWVRFGELIEDADAGWSPNSENFSRSGDNWGVLKVSAVSWNRFLPEENKQLLPGVIPPKTAQVHAGDFLISRANTSELVAKCVVVEQEPQNLILSDKIVRLQISESCSKQFLSLVINHSKHARTYYAEKASGTSFSMKNVSRDVIYMLPVPLPPFSEQQRIVAKVDKLMALCDRLEKELTTKQTQACRFLESVLDHALNDQGISENAKMRLPV